MPNKPWFIIVEYLKCPFCGMTFDPKGLHKEEDDDSNELVECRFCHRKAPINHGERESRI